MKISVYHPTGNRNVRAILSSFYEADILQDFNTAISVRGNSRWLRWLPGSIQSEFLRRSFPIPENKINTRAFKESLRMVFLKLGFTNLVASEKAAFSIDSVYQDFDKAASQRLSFSSKQEINAVYCYEDGAAYTFKAAKEKGIARIYDLPIAYWETSRRLLFEEAERLPQWKKTLGGGIDNSTEKLERKTRELQLADIIIAPGQFVADSIPDWAKSKKLIVSPFGSPETKQIILKKDKKPISSSNRPLRVLFAGSMGQRKGLGDLMKAMNLLNSRHVELVVMGSMLESMDFYKSEYSDFTYEAGRPHEEVLQLMRSCDVLCLPSIVEGRALVLQEAMSQGLPLIITPNTGGADLIIEGKTGFLIPIRRPDMMAEKIDWFATHREEVLMMSEAAQVHASRYTWGMYGHTIVTEISSYLN